MALGGYSDVARALNEQFSLDPPIDRRSVERWYKRRTLNAAGLPPPDPVVDLPGVLPRQPHLMFESGQWIGWAEAGWPAPHSSQHSPVFETPHERNARYREADRQALAEHGYFGLSQAVRERVERHGFVQAGSLLTSVITSYTMKMNTRR